jgi:GGDEF domain-containing protein
MHMDIGEPKHHEQQLQAKVTHDALTGLPARAAQLPALQQAVARWQGDPLGRFALLFLDFDRFKRVNDTLGHAAGDELLRQMTERLQSALRDGGSGRVPDTLAPWRIRRAGHLRTAERRRIHGAPGRSA